MTKKMKVMTMGFCAAMLSLSSLVSAGPITYDVTLSGDWFYVESPFGMPPSPVLQGTLTVDSANAGTVAAFVDFSIATGSKTWTLDDFTGDPANDLTASFDVGGALINFGLSNWQIGGSEFLFIYSNNTVSVGDGRLEDACNHCQSNATVPAPATIALMGLGLLGVRLRRKA